MNEKTFTREVEFDGGHVRLYATAKSEGVLQEYFSIGIHSGQVSAGFTTYDFETLKKIRDMCDDALSELKGGNDEKRNNNDN